MPIDFRSYTNPNVYVESVIPQVLQPTPGVVTPIVPALVGLAPGFDQVTESLALTGTTSGQLQSLGVDPSSLLVTDRILGSTYISGAAGTLASSVTSGVTSFSVNEYWTPPAAPFDMQVDSEQVTVTTRVGSNNPFTYTVTRAANSTVAAAHLTGQVLNRAKAYTSAGLGTLATAVNATALSLSVTEGGTGGVGVLNANIATTGATSCTVNLNSGVTLPAVNFNILIGTEELTVTAVSGVSNPYTLTIARGVNGTSAATHSLNDVVSPVAPFSILLESEAMVVTARTGSVPNMTYTVARGVHGTSAAGHGVAAAVTWIIGSDFLVTLGAGSDGTLVSNDDTTSITRNGSRMPDTSSSAGGVNLTFKATDPFYYTASLFDNFNDVADRFGSPFDVNGSLNSALTLGAWFAFQNGASQVMLAALKPGATNSDWQTAIARLENEPSVDIVVPLSGDNSTGGPQDLVKSHITAMSSQGFLRRAIFGRDGYSGTVTFTDFMNQATALNNARISLVAPAKFQMDNGMNSTPFNAAGYFAAAAVAGSLASRDPQAPLTRKQIFGFGGSGFDPIVGQDTNTNILAMQSKGVVVLFEDRDNNVIVRHGLTTAMSDVYSREISVIAARDSLTDLVTTTLTSSELLGGTLDTHTPDLVVASVEAALEVAVAAGLIVDYNGIQYRIPNDQPTTIEVQFNYKPTLPLNYIHVIFSVDTSTGTVSDNTAITA